jgi:solute carrier family 25 (mitochondrial phosphate transporter), member 23/24/25/41
MSKIYSFGGLQLFFRGNIANILKVGPESAIRMFLFDYLRDHYSKDRYNVTMIERFFCGGFAAFFAETIAYPLEVAKTRMALSKMGTYNGFSHCIKESYAHFGLRGVYAGLSIS